MRTALTFDCNGAVLAATLDAAPGAVGLLIVSGGNELRCGAHRGMAALAAEIASQRFPVMRFDRRGIGDSDGSNQGFLSSRDDIAAAVAAFRSVCPAVSRIVAFGNCDAASALVLHQPLAVDALVLANPWTIDAGDTADESSPSAAPMIPASAIRARYWSRLRDPASLMRLLRGQIDLRKLVHGLRRAARPARPAAPEALGEQVVDAIVAAPQPVTVLLAKRDRTAQAFADHWRSRSSPQVQFAALDSASHSFAGDDAQWLCRQLIEALNRAAPAP